MTAAFPAIQPSSRTLTPGAYPHAMLRTMGGLQSQVRHSNSVVAARLILSFSVVTADQLSLIRTHFLYAAGSFATFSLPAIIWTATTDPTLSGYNWRYANRPSINEVGCNRYDVSIEFEGIA
jgi:hypothetical protein